MELTPEITPEQVWELVKDWPMDPRPARLAWDDTEKGKRWHTMDTRTLQDIEVEAVAAEERYVACGLKWLAGQGSVIPSLGDLGEPKAGQNRRRWLIGNEYGDNPVVIGTGPTALHAVSAAVMSVREPA